MRGYDVFLIVLAILALFSLNAGELVFGLFFSIIGIPLAVLIMVLPALALIFGSARILDRLLLSRFLPKWISGRAAFGAVLAVLASIASHDNSRQAAEVGRLLAGDHDNLTRPLPDQAYALLTQSPKPVCSDFCQRLLLTGQATAVLITQANAQAAESLDPATPVTLWQIEDLPTCPDVALPTNTSRMSIKGEQPDIAAPRADLLIREGIAVGHCLTATPSTLAKADVVIVDVTLRNQKLPPGFAKGEETIGASRYAVWLKTEQGLIEQARWTYASALQMFPLAIPLANVEIYGEGKVGFARIGATGYPNNPGFDAFADQILGLRLALSDAGTPLLPAGEDPLLAQLQKPGVLNANTQQLVTARLDALRISTQSTPTEADRALFLQLLSDPRVPLQWPHVSAAGTLLRDAPPDFAAGVAEIGFTRMDNLLLPDQHLDTLLNELSFQGRNAILKRVYPIKEQIGLLGNVLAQLPDAALEPYGPAIFALAKDRENRAEPYRLLIRLNSFGDPGARALLDLLADADSVNSDRPIFDDHREHAYIAAMIGLCQMGPKAALILPDLLKLVGSGEVSLTNGAAADLIVETLVRLGQSPESIPALAANGKHPIPAAELERALARANREKGCEY